MKTQIYDDFGLKIDGAKKFNYSNNPTNINSTIETVSKNVIWPEPEIGQRDLFVDFIIHKLRDCIRTTFKSENPLLIDEFVSQVLAIKVLMENVKTEEEAINVIRRLDFEKNEDGSPLFNKKLLFTKRLKFWELTRSQMELEGFGLTKEEKDLKRIKTIVKSFIINSSFEFRENFLIFKENNRSYTFPIKDGLRREDLVIGKLIIVDSGVVIGINKSLEYYESYLQVCLEKEREDLKNSRKRIRIQLPHLEKVQHIGSDYRNNRDVLPEALKDKFNFYGGQFGNWLTQKERAKVVNLAFDAFSDLAYALDIKDRDISFNGELGIAFGARGHGKSNAHYEPSYHVINLTRLRGAGSLAHEWGHALDHRLAEIYGDNSKLLTDQERSALNSLNNIISELVNITSQYRLDSLALDTYENRKKPYWSQTSEMFARAFNTYVIQKLKTKGIINDYLCYEFDISIKINEERKAYAHPIGASWERLEPLLDNLVNDLKQKGILHPRDGNNHIGNIDTVYHFVNSLNLDQISFF